MWRGERISFQHQRFHHLPPSLCPVRSGQTGHHNPHNHSLRSPSRRLAFTPPHLHAASPSRCRPCPRKTWRWTNVCGGGGNEVVRRFNRTKRPPDAWGGRFYLMVGTLMAWLQDADGRERIRGGFSKAANLGWDQVLPWWAREGQSSVEVKKNRTSAWAAVQVCL